MRPTPPTHPIFSVFFYAEGWCVLCVKTTERSRERTIFYSTPTNTHARTHPFQPSDGAALSPPPPPPPPDAVGAVAAAAASGRATAAAAAPARPGAGPAWALMSEESARGSRSGKRGVTVEPARSPVEMKKKRRDDERESRFERESKGGGGGGSTDAASPALLSQTLSVTHPSTPSAGLACASPAPPSARDPRPGPTPGRARRRAHRRRPRRRLLRRRRRRRPGRRPVPGRRGLS